MKKYTFIAEYLGGTFINQFSASKLIDALHAWGNDLDPNIYKKKDVLLLNKEICDVDFFPVAVKTVDNVWCCSFLFGKSFLLLNIVETV